MTLPKAFRRFKDRKKSRDQWIGQKTMFKSPPLHLVDEGGSPTLGLWGWLSTQHWTLADETESSLYSQPQRRTQRVYSGAELTARGCGRQDCSIKKVGAFWFMPEDVIGLFE